MKNFLASFLTILCLFVGVQRGGQVIIGGVAVATGISIGQHVSAATASGISNTVSVSFTSNTAGENIFAACDVFLGVGTSISGIADTKSNIYTLIEFQNQGNSQLHTWVAKNVAAGANTVTCTGTSNPAMGLAAVEVLGTSITSPVDVHNNGGSQVAGPTFSSGSVTNVSANEIFLTAVQGLAPGATCTVNSSFTLLESVVGGSGGSGNSISLASLIVSSTGAKNPTWTCTGSGFGWAQIAGLKP